MDSRSLELNPENIKAGNTLKVAVRTNPEEAKKYAQTVLSNAYSKGDVLI